MTTRILLQRHCWDRSAQSVRARFLKQVAKTRTQFTEIAVLDAAHTAGIIPDHFIQHWRGNYPPPFTFAPLDIGIKTSISDRVNGIWNVLKPGNNVSTDNVSKGAYTRG